MNAKQNAEVDSLLTARGIVRLPDSAYGEGVGYLMIRVSWRKSPIRVTVTQASLAASRGAA